VSVTSRSSIETVGPIDSGVARIRRFLSPRISAIPIRFVTAMSPPRGCATADRALFTTQAALGLSYVSSTASRGTIAGKTERTDSVVGHLASELDPISDHFFAAVFSRRFHLQDDHIRRSLLDPNHRLLLRNRCR